LISCHNITDVSPLANVNNLNLSGCQVSDVSSLGKVHTLDLSICDNISDVSALGNVHTLDIGCCPKVVDLSALENVSCFRNYGFRGNDLSGLKNVTILDISFSRKVSDITMFRSSLIELNIEGCELIRDLNGFDHLEKLAVNGRTGIPSREHKDSILLPKLRKLKVFFVENAFWIEPSFLLSLLTLRELVLGRCDSLENLPSLPNLRSLTILSCQKFEYLPIFSSLCFLDISDCKNLIVLEIPGNATCKYPIYSVFVRGCGRLATLKIDRRVFNCKIERNDKLEIIELSQQVGHLKIDRESITNLKKIMNQSLVVSLQFVGSDFDPPYQLNDERDEMNFRV
jgi:hypothetical protein